VAWAKEKPIHRWIDILYLAERLAPKPALIPADATQRALMIGFSHEICGEKGIGWNRRLQLFAPAYASGSPPAGIGLMGSKYGYNEGDAKAAGERTAASLRALAAQLESQYARGVHYFVGDSLSALDIYWTSFANLLDPLPKEQCPMPEAWRPGFTASDPAIKEALAPLLLEHRSRIFRDHFRDPMEL
jgi:glutathione S-transferase